MNDFVVFIITHGRPDNIKTFDTLKKCGYTGKIYFIVDNEDKTINRYIENFGTENVKVFDKKYYADLVDEGNNFDNRKTTTHARNACFDISRELGFKHFLVLDDDYTSFEFRYVAGLKLKVIKINNADKIFGLYKNFLCQTPILSIAFAQGGDFIGGANNPYVIKRPMMRKIMNSFFCSTDRQFKFIGQLNEDVNTYVTLGSTGGVFGTVPMISIVQAQTQSSIGGMTEAYMKYGTFVKSFTTVMMHPSGCKVAMMNSSNPRIHHLIKWNNTTPMIIRETNKKK